MQTLALNQFHLSIFDWIACVLLCDCIIYDVVLDARCSMLNTFGFDFLTLRTNWEKNQLKLVIKRYEIKLSIELNTETFAKRSGNRHRRHLF